MERTKREFPRQSSKLGETTAARGCFSSLGTSELEAHASTTLLNGESTPIKTHRRTNGLSRPHKCGKVEVHCAQQLAKMDIFFTWVLRGLICYCVLGRTLVLVIRLCGPLTRHITSSAFPHDEEL